MKRGNRGQMINNTDIAQAVAQRPMDRIGWPDEIAKAALFLASAPEGKRAIGAGGLERCREL